MEENKMLKGHFIVKTLCIMCVAQIIFTVYIAVRVLNAALSPEHYLLGASELARRSKEAALAVGDLSQIDMNPQVEIKANDDEEKPVDVAKKFMMKPLAVWARRAADEQNLNHLIVSGNKENYLKNGKLQYNNYSQKPKHNATKHPLLTKFDIRPLDDVIMPSNDDTIMASVVSINREKSKSSVDRLPVSIADVDLVKNIFSPKVERNNSIGGSSVLKKQFNSFKETNPGQMVLIYGKAAIGQYLWNHILSAELLVDLSIPGTLTGRKTIDGITFLYKEGPAVIPSDVYPPPGTEHLVLIANGRENKKVQAMRLWLDHFAARRPRLKVLVVILGSEQCDNKWLKDYVSSGLVRSVFVTYDDPVIDNNVYYQWPLGVATYRQFPLLSHSVVKGNNPSRRFRCSVRATLHSESPSRLQLQQLLRPFVKRKICSANFRDSWIASENRTTMTEYVQSLLQSDLVLCPVGVNAETYRIYEAMEAGAVPVVENRQPSSAGDCDEEPFRLLKESDAPLLWVSSWYELQQILEHEARLTSHERAARRDEVRRWYRNFKHSMRLRFVDVVKRTLLGT